MSSWHSLTVYDGSTNSGTAAGSGGGSYNITIECGDPADLANGRASCSCPGTRCDLVSLLGIVVDGDGDKEALFTIDTDLPNGLRVQNVLNALTGHLNQAVGTKGEMERSGGDRCDGGDPSPNTCFSTGGARTSHRTWLGESRCGCSFIDWVIRRYRKRTCKDDHVRQGCVIRLRGRATTALSPAQAASGKKVESSFLCSKLLTSILRRRAQSG